MKIVVDASVAAKWVVDEEGTEAALDLLDAANDLHAPDFILTEIGNVLWKKARRREISADQAHDAIGQIARCFDALDPTAPLGARALQMAIEADHPIYDCLYFACAEREHAIFVTGDRRAHLKAQHFGTFASRLLSDPLPRS